MNKVIVVKFVLYKNVFNFAVKLIEQIKTTGLGPYFSECLQSQEVNEN